MRRAKRVEGWVRAFAEFFATWLFAVRFFTATTARVWAAAPYPPPYPPPYQPQFPSQNPYQAPNPWGDNFYSPGYVPVADRGRALSKVFGPAILMQIYGAVIVISGITLAISIPFIVADAPRNDQIAIIVLVGVGVFFCVALGAFTFWGGMRMKALRSYTLVMTAVVITFLIGFLTCLPAMVLGIWPLIVLLDGEVKACFDRPDARLHH